MTSTRKPPIWAIAGNNQVLGMTLFTMMFALFGFLSPSNRGGLMTALLLLFVLMGLVAGYVSSRMYKSFKGVEWKMTVSPSSMALIWTTHPDPSTRARTCQRRVGVSPPTGHTETDG